MNNASRRSRPPGFAGAPATRLPPPLVPILCLAALLIPACGVPRGASTTCEACHRGLESASPSHEGCTGCHGGKAEAADRESAHRDMFGPRNPSGPDDWDRTCGRCHPYQLARVKSGLMYTNAGMIRNIRATWESEGDALYASRAGAAFGADGRPATLSAVEGLDDLSGELYRKFCSLCHLGAEPTETRAASHAAGCAACHFPFADNAVYGGGDPSVRGRRGYSESHEMARLPGNRACLRCHNRSGRIGLSYEGLHDGNNALVPTRDGRPGPRLISGGRSVTRIRPDVHHAGGMECIDCHTSREVMGDGYVHGNLYEQVEVRCEDCHGSPQAAPRTEAIARENDEALRESRSYGAPVRPGMRMVLTSKGRKYSNVFARGGEIFVMVKRTGRLLKAKVITGTPEHTVAGHERMHCDACHSRTVAQCFGCHTTYDRTRTGADFIRDEDAPGAFTETEDYRMLYPFPLALDERGRISPVTPGCQTFITVIDGYGRTVRREQVARYRGKPQLRFAPFHPHSTGDKAIGCRACHGNPAFLGFGQHVLEGASIRGTFLCEKSDRKALDGFLSLDAGTVTPTAAVTRAGSRPLSGGEVRAAWAVNLCIVCHDQAKDKVYRKRIDFRALDDALHRRLLAGR
ncbi:MAG: selenite/tellurite reduction operon c-type cytochrome ExtM [Gemmatimonadota bacterium]